MNKETDWELKVCWRWNSVRVKCKNEKKKAKRRYDGTEVKAWAWEKKTIICEKRAAKKGRAIKWNESKKCTKSRMQRRRMRTWNVGKNDWKWQPAMTLSAEKGKNKLVVRFFVAENWTLVSDLETEFVVAVYCRKDGHKVCSSQVDIFDWMGVLGLGNLTLLIRQWSLPYGLSLHQILQSNLASHLLASIIMLSCSLLILEYLSESSWSESLTCIGPWGVSECQLMERNHVEFSSWHGYSVENGKMLHSPLKCGSLISVMSWG